MGTIKLYLVHFLLNIDTINENTIILDSNWIESRKTAYISTWVYTVRNNNKICIDPNCKRRLKILLMEVKSNGVFCRHLQVIVTGYAFRSYWSDNSHALPWYDRWSIRNAWVHVIFVAWGSSSTYEGFPFCLNLNQSAYWSISYFRARSNAFDT